MTITQQVHRKTIWWDEWILTVFFMHSFGQWTVVQVFILHPEIIFKILLNDLKCFFLWISVIVHVRSLGTMTQNQKITTNHNSEALNALSLLFIIKPKIWELSLFLLIFINVSCHHTHIEHAHCVRLTGCFPSLCSFTC